MGFYSGNSGSIQFGRPSDIDEAADTGWQSTPTKISSWSLNTAQALLDTTTLGVYDKTSVYGLRTTSGTLRFFYYTQEGAVQSDGTNNSASWFIRTVQRDENQTSPESISAYLRLYVDDKNMTGSLNNRELVEFEANITSVNYGSNVGELVAVDVSFEATGPLNRVWV